VGYVAARPGGAIVLDCTDLTLVSGGGAAAIRALLGEVTSNNRVSQLRHVSAQMQQELDRLAVSDRGAEDGEAGDREGLRAEDPNRL
jgi:anti-anti-sigma regulatory factor